MVAGAPGRGGAAACPAAVTCPAEVASPGAGACPASIRGADSTDKRVTSAASAPARLNTGYLRSGDTGTEVLSLLKMLDDDGRWMAGNWRSGDGGDVGI